MKQPGKRRKDETPLPTPRQLGALAANEGKPLSGNPFAAEAACQLGGLPVWTMLDVFKELDIDPRLIQDMFRPAFDWQAGWWEQHKAMGDRLVQAPDEGPVEMVSVTDADGHAVDVARFSDDRGTPEMRNQQEVYETVIYEKGKKVVDGKEQEVKEMRKVSRVRDLMGDLHRRGLLTLEEMKAGRTFRRDFEVGQLDPRRAADIRRAGGGGRGESDRLLEARDRVGRAMEALGGHGSINGQCAWWCLGVGLTPKEWGAKKVFGRGRALSEQTARGIVMATCGLLMVHYERERLDALGEV